MRKSAVIALGLALGGCGGEAVDLGDNGGQPSFEGQWVGSLKSDVFLRPSEFMYSERTLRLTLDAAGHGSLLVGDSVLPPPTDPNVGYPPEAQADAGDTSGMGVHLYSGVSYPLENVTASGNTLNVAIDALHAFDAFCALQTPVETESGDYACEEPSGHHVDRSGGEKTCFYYHDTNLDQMVEEDCIRIYLCRNPFGVGCYCTATECHAGSNGSSYAVSFDLDLKEEQTALSGKYAYWIEEPPGSPQSVEFWRQ